MQLYHQGLVSPHKGVTTGSSQHLCWMLSIPCSSYPLQHSPPCSVLEGWPLKTASWSILTSHELLSDLSNGRHGQETAGWEERSQAVLPHAPLPIPSQLSFKFLSFHASFLLNIWQIKLNNIESMGECVWIASEAHSGIWGDVQERLSCSSGGSLGSASQMCPQRNDVWGDGYASYPDRLITHRINVVESHSVPHKYGKVWCVN